MSRRSPCRPCDDRQLVSLSRRDWKALELAAHQGREASAHLADARAEIARLRQIIADLHRRLDAAAEGDPRP